VNDRTRNNYDLNRLLHPAQAFGHPSDVLGDPALTLIEKRAILASWASDACVVETASDLRSKASGAPVLFDDIMKALRTLDQKANGHRYRRVLHHWRGSLRRHPASRSNGGSATAR
jgi:hypothetical protein